LRRIQMRGDDLLEREITRKLHRVTPQARSAFVQQPAKHLAGREQLPTQRPLRLATDNELSEAERRKQNRDNERGERNEDLRAQAAASPPPPGSRRDPCIAGRARAEPSGRVSRTAREPP